MNGYIYIYINITGPGGQNILYYYFFFIISYLSAFTSNKCGRWPAIVQGDVRPQYPNGSIFTWSCVSSCAASVLVSVTVAQMDALWGESGSNRHLRTSNIFLLLPLFVVAPTVLNILRIYLFGC